MRHAFTLFMMYSNAESRNLRDLWGSSGPYLYAPMVVPRALGTSKIVQ